MWPYFKIELLKFFKNRKNIAVYVLLTCFVIYFGIKIAPAYDPIEKVNLSEIQANYDNRHQFAKTRGGKDNDGTHPAVIYALGVFVKWNEIDAVRIEELLKNEDLDKPDLRNYARVTSEWYLFTDAITYGGDLFYYNPRYYTYGNLDAHQDGHYAYLATASRYAGYADLDFKVTQEVLEEFTAIQTLYRLMEDYLPYVLLIGCLLLSVDIVLQDRKYPTLLRGYPIADWKKIIIKAATALVGSIAILIPILIGYFIVGVQFGFGSLQIPVPVRVGSSYETITLATYFAKSGLLILGWFAVIISFVILLSLIIRSEIANLIGGILLVFSEFAYRDKGIGFFKPVENYPPSYIDVGKVITNAKNTFYESSGILFGKGITLILCCAGIFALLSLIITLNKRYRFIK